MTQLWQRSKSLSFTLAKQQAFLEDIAALIEDGVSATQAIEMLSKIATGQTIVLVDAILLAIGEGKQFADGLEGWFPIHIIEIIRAGEESGDIAQAMRAAVDALERKQSALTSLLSSLTYPFIVILFGIGVMLFVNHFIFVDFRSIVPVYRWPAHAQSLVFFATWLESWWWLVILIVIATLISITYILKNYIGRFRVSLDHLPFVTLYKEFIAARFMETLGMLISNGLVLKRALDILKTHATPYLTWHLMMMEYRLGLGYESVGDVLDTGLIRSDDVLRLRLIMQNKRFENTLLSLGERAAIYAQRRVMRSGRFLGSLLLLSSAGLAILIIFSIYDVGALLGGSVT